MFNSPMHALEYLTQMSNDYIGGLQPAARFATEAVTQQAINTVRDGIEPQPGAEAPQQTTPAKTSRVKAKRGKTAPATGAEGG